MPESSPRVSIDLPTFFEMPAPTVVVTDGVTGETSVGARRHAGSFAVDPEGDFFVQQYREDGGSVLGAIRADGETYRYF